MALDDTEKIALALFGALGVFVVAEIATRPKSKKTKRKKGTTAKLDSRVVPRGRETDVAGWSATTLQRRAG